MNLFKLLGSLGNMSKIQAEMKLVAEQIGDLEFEGTAGGDMVRVRVSGAQKLISCSIDSRLIDDRERELIEELVVTAANHALGQAKEEAAKIMQKALSEKLDMPEIGDMIGQFMPKP